MPEGTAAQQTYYVRVEYPVVAYATLVNGGGILERRAEQNSLT